MLATVLHLMKGTPYIYQGEEFGMTNAVYTDIGQFRDIETLNYYELQVAAGISPQAFIAGANANGRDNARTPMQWSNVPQAGFSTGPPWIDVNPNYTHINAEQACRDPASVHAHYRRLVQLRKELPLIVDGDYRPWLEEHPQLFAYSRRLDGQTLTVVANFGATRLQLDVPPGMQVSGQALIGNYSERPQIGPQLSLEPYEAFAILS
jgi:oligo-1,6-glucosidase